MLWYQRSLGTIYALTIELLNENTPVSAIIGVNDMTAGSIMKALTDKSYKIPHRLYLWCYFSFPVSKYVPITPSAAQPMQVTANIGRIPMLSARRPLNHGPPNMPIE